MTIKTVLTFMREEITHVRMAMDITASDAEAIKGMTKEELYEWVQDKQEAVSYADTTEAKASRFYEWRAGKEFCEGEGERGLFDFSLDKWRNDSRVEQRPIGINHVTSVERAGGSEYESFMQAVCSCGWKGKPQSCYNNWQMHDCNKEANRHLEEVKK